MPRHIPLYDVSAQLSGVFSKKKSFAIRVLHESQQDSRP